MHGNESRLFKAARRTIRAEATLVVVIIIITSWSIFALYRLTIGSESIFGLVFDAKSSHLDKISKDVLNKTPIGVNESSTGPVNSLQRHLIYSKPIDEQPIEQQVNFRNLIMQRLASGQRELNDNLRASIGSQVQQHYSAPNILDYEPISSVSHNNKLSQFHPRRDQNYQRNLLNQWQPYVDRGPPLIHVQSRSRRQKLEETNSDEPTLEERAVNSDRYPSESSVQPESVNNPIIPMEEDGQSEEITTERPVEEVELSSQDQEENTTISPTTDSTDEKTEDQGDEESEQAENEPPSETSSDIDEEVDRMTQPSLGVASQQDGPLDYKNIVQFDDTSSNGLDGTNNQASKKPIAHKRGDLIVDFLDPQTKKKHGNKAISVTNNSNDLQVDHNTPKVSSGFGSLKTRDVDKIDNELELKLKTEQQQADRISELSNNTQQSAGRSTGRPKRSATKISAPYEIDGFLNKLNFDTFLEFPDRRVVAKRSARSLEHKQQENSNHSLGNKVGPRQVEDSIVVARTTLNPRKVILDSTRQQAVDEEESDVDKYSSLDQMSPREQMISPEYHYLASNDSALQKLLAEQQLVEALKQSQLPSPAYSLAANRSSQSKPPAIGSDHQTAGTLYSIDHGLMLYPSADEESKHESMSKKKKKHEKMKDKKKMTVALKKGGHKKKKHKKEEKKFLKEKKFKGAKKGKKVSKGKGGQGGKKGKKLYKDKGFKKKGFKNVYHKEEFGQKKSYFDEFRDKDFKKKWKKFDDKYNYAKMKKWQAKDVKGAKKMKDHGENFKKYDKSRWKKKYQKHSKEHKASSKKKKDSFGFK